MSAFDVQVGGGHYKRFAIQPTEFLQANRIPFCEGNAIKYLCRWRDKGGIVDLEKARHYIDILIEMEGKPEPAKLSNLELNRKAQAEALALYGR